MASTSPWLSKAPGHYPDEVRNYVRRIRKVLAALEIPCAVVNRPGRGYSLEFRTDNVIPASGTR
jgi:hypothetical protein